MRSLECRMDVFRELLEELLARGSSATFRVSGMSMHPTIKDGDVITVEAVDASVVRRGDIVAYQLCDKLCVHRVVTIRRRGVRDTVILTAGDGLGDPDAPLEKDALLGRVVEVRTADGVWRPDAPMRRAEGLARASLGLHPRTQLAIYKVRRAFLGRANGANSMAEEAGLDT